MVIESEIKGDILDTELGYILHQTNCVTKSAQGLAKSIAERYPWADVYAQRACACADIPGTVKFIKGGINSSLVSLVSLLTSDDNKTKTIICAFAQFAPGKALVYSKQYPGFYVDSNEQRIKWFQQCLDQIDQRVPQSEKVAVPFKIGCGLAGGDWNIYKKMLQDAKTVFIVYSIE